jgi:hypothetical protein
MKRYIFYILAVFVCFILLSPVFANDESDSLFDSLFTESDDIEDMDFEDVVEDQEDDTIIELSDNPVANITVNDDTVEDTTIEDNTTDDNSNNNNTDSADELESFNKEWTEFISTTEYERYSNSKKTIKQIESEKEFNCYDGAYWTIYLATKHGLKAEIVHGFWDGIGHGAVYVYFPDGSREMFDTTQYQKGYGRNGLENSIYWDKIDNYSTKEAKKKANKYIESNPGVVSQVKEIINIENEENRTNDLSVNLSSNLSTDLSLEKLFNIV